MQALKEEPSVLQCNDKFLVQSVAVPPGTTPKDITPEMVPRGSSDHQITFTKVYEGSVASKNNISSGASVATLNGTQIESVKQYSQLLSEASRAATAGDCDSDHHFMAVINPFDRPADDITIEADYISVDDKKFFKFPKSTILSYSICNDWV